MYGVIPLALIYLHSVIKFPLSKMKFDFRFLLYTLYSVLRLLLIAVIIYILTFIPFFVAGHTWAQWWELHRQMWYYHTHLVATHAYQSTPKEWIFSLRPVWYYVHYGDKISNIYAQGNPMVLWLGLVGLLSILPGLLQFPVGILILLYAIFTVPWIFSPRIMFFYHYLPSATFLCIILAYWLLQIPRKVRVGLLICCVISLAILSPVYFGFPMVQSYWDTLFKVFPSWK
jgi:dolichyl-phosphate-mannose--protein O-mannosyl transferase